MIKNSLEFAVSHTGRGVRRIELCRVIQHASELGRKTVSPITKLGALTMRKLLVVILFLVSVQVFASDEEVTLFDGAGKPVAYIAEELTIYLWSGKPVAYLHSDSGKLHVFGFNGKHLGWFVKGIVRDHEGNAVGAVKQTFRSSVEYEPYKSHKQYKPYQGYREYAPYQPYLSTSWSEMPLRLFLLQGASN